MSGVASADAPRDAGLHFGPPADVLQGCSHTRQSGVLELDAAAPVPFHVNHRLWFSCR